MKDTESWPREFTRVCVCTIIPFLHTGSVISIHPCCAPAESICSPTRSFVRAIESIVTKSHVSDYYVAPHGRLICGRRLPPINRVTMTGATVHGHRQTSRLIRAVGRSDVNATISALNSGADPNTRNRDGTPLLVLAAKHGSLRIVRALLKSSGRPNIRSRSGSTALLEAVQGRHVPIVTELLSNGAEVNAAYPMKQGGSAPLIVAAEAGDASLVRKLLGSHANVNAKDSEGDDALIAAAKSGDVSIATNLVDRGATVDSRDQTGMTPLKWAAFGGHLTTVQYLVPRGANVKARDDRSQQAIGREAFLGNDAAIRKLAGPGKPRVFNADGRSVLDWARIGGHNDMVEYLRTLEAM